MSSSRPGLLIASGLVLLACTQDQGTREKAHVRDAEVPEAAALPPCMWTLEACPEHITWRLDTLLRASELAAHASFIAIGGQVIGVSRGTSGSKSVVRVHMDDEIERYGDRFRHFTLPKTVVTLIDVVDGVAEPGNPPTVYALACRQRRSACSLWRVSADEPAGTALEEIADSTFDGHPTALLFDDDQHRPCVLDGSLYCFDGTWHEDIAPSHEDGDLRDVAMGLSMSIAVAEHGVYWTRPGVAPDQPAMQWTRQSVDADVSWTGASDIYRGYFLIGERGAFMQSLADASTLCSHTSDFVASSGSVLVTKSGDVLFGLNEARCVLQSLGPDAIVASATAYCRASQNLLLMTEQSVLGTTFCARL